MVCVKEAEAILLKEIKRINVDILKEYKLEMRLVRNGCQSKIVVEEIDFN